MSDTTGNLRPKSVGRAPMVAYKSVVKRFGKFVALNGVDGAVYPREVVCLIGPSGSGKSTLLRCTNALERIDDGVITFDGTPLPALEKQVRAVRQRMGMVFQSFELFPHMSAIANVMAGPLTVLNIDGSAARRRAELLLQKVGLADKADSFPAMLSGGEQQRVAIARALAMEPEMMLFDEPTSALDPETVGEVLSVMRQLADEGMTMLVVTHEMNFARKVGDWIVVFDRGRVVEEGPPDVIFENPQAERTRSFLSHIGWNA